MGLIVPDYVATWPSLAVKAIGRHFKKLFIGGTQDDIQSSSFDNKQTSSPQPPAKQWVPSDKEPLHPLILDLTVDLVQIDVVQPGVLTIITTPSRPSTPL